MLGYVALLFSIANFAVVSVGLSSHQGSIVSALLNLGQGLGRPCVGVLSDKLGRINIATSLSFLCGVFCLVIWINAHNMGVVCFFAVLGGTVAGTYWATVTPVLAEIIGLRDLPSGLSVNWLVLVVPCTVSEAIALHLRDGDASLGRIYLRVQLFTGFMYVGAALCLWVVRGWKVGDLARAKQETVVGSENHVYADADGSVIEAGGEKPHAHNAAALPQASVEKTDIWSPATLMRGMVTLKKV